MANVLSYFICICAPIATRSTMDTYSECLITYCVHLHSSSDTQHHYYLWRMCYHMLYPSAFQKRHATPWTFMANVLSYIVIICTPVATRSIMDTYGKCLIIYCMHLHSSSNTQHHGDLWRMSYHILYASALQ